MIKSWYLAGAPVDGNTLLFPMDCFPVTVGRSRKCTLTIDSNGVSRTHARIETEPKGNLQIVDLESTNGTFVNRARIAAPTTVKEGDILHFGSAEFRLKRRDSISDSQFCGDYTLNHTCIAPPGLDLPENFLLLEKEFIEMLAQNRLKVAWQPIVDSRTYNPVAYEVLGRGDHQALPQCPTALFSFAQKLKKEVALSQAFRTIAAKVAAKKGKRICLFMNSHPAEMFTEELYLSVADIQSIAPNMELVMEVHETAVTEGDKMKNMATRLGEMGVKIAYDDFGSGQSRLEELANIPADFVKFARNMICDIDRASNKKQQLVEKLVNIVSSIGSMPLAEGIETKAEAVICRQMGFELYQGNLTGRPKIVKN
jgi:EAL domain-containing protein (putative c-di-GMP-specific phosphodiesterase class I)